MASDFVSDLKHKDGKILRDDSQNFEKSLWHNEDDKILVLMLVS